MSKVLLVEDDQTIRNTLQNRLVKLGFDVVEASDGQQALDLLKASPQYDLILLDLIMPLVSGFEVLEFIKINQKLPIPVLVLSNLDQDADVQTAKNLGAVDYILKSNSSLQEIATKINQYLKL